MKSDQPLSLVVLGPGNHADARIRHRAGDWYAAQAVAGHTPCLNPAPDGN